MNIPLRDSRLDAIRLFVVQVIGDTNSLDRLTPEIIARIKEAIEKLK